MVFQTNREIPEDDSGQIGAGLRLFSSRPLRILRALCGEKPLTAEIAKKSRKEREEIGAFCGCSRRSASSRSTVIPWLLTDNLQPQQAFASSHLGSSH